MANSTNMANLTIFRQRPKCKRMSSRQGYQRSGEFHEYGEFGKYGEFDDISPNTKMQANELKTRVSTKWRIPRIYMVNLTIFRQPPKCKRMSSRQGYQQSGEFHEYGEFGKYGEFDDISPNTKMHANELKTRVPTKWRIPRIWQI